MSSSIPAKAPRLMWPDPELEMSPNWNGLVCPIITMDLKKPPLKSRPVRRAMSPRMRQQLQEITKTAKELRQSIQMTLKAKGRNSSPIDPSAGDWGAVDKAATFKAINRLLALASGGERRAELPRCSPSQLGAVLNATVGNIARAQGKQEGDGSDNAFENAPVFWDVPEPVMMRLKPRDIRESRRLRGLPVIRMDLAAPAGAINSAVAGNWGDIDLDALFPALNDLIQLIAEDGAEVPLCKPNELPGTLNEIAERLEQSAEKDKPVEMSCKTAPSNRKIPGKSFTEADRAAARRLLGRK
ncbi:hypothetical protein Pan44_27110 [Caulifigura coniformis]|uniref:Uncharacterized protein n=1 Tax=Caulifigura coniformis TaxID=2527983 RepID=A0A517SEW7_9PLAN|nr:hypothetical protein [Caulifigura coniformis]QDT54676.1 hypothetical protein Pan44_27110 [Caulifigura coniformis]